MIRVEGVLRKLRVGGQYNRIRNDPVSVVDMTLPDFRKNTPSAMSS